MCTYTTVFTWLGSIARLFTVLVESDDWAFQLQNYIAVGLMTTLVIQLHIYKDKVPRAHIIEEHHKDLDQEKEVIIREANQDQSMLVEDKVDDIAQIAKNSLNPYFKE